MRMRFAAFVLVFSFALSGTTSAASPTSPASSASAAALESLLVKSRNSSGAPYLLHVVSKSHETVDKRTFDVTTETEGLRYRARKCFKDICSGFYFDGERSYESNFNDTALPVSSAIDGFQLTLRAIASYDFASPDFRKNGGTLVEHDPVLREGKSYRRLTVTPRLGAPLDAVLDPETGIVAGVLSDARRIAFEFRDQRKVGGKVTLPFAVAINGTVVEKFDDRQIDPEPLAAPAGVGVKFNGSATVPLRKLDRASPQVVVDCTIGGETIPCLLDTGNSGMSMSLELAEKLNLEPQTGAFDISGVGAYVTGIVKAPPMTVGPATYGSARYVVLHDLHQYGYDLVLGADAFARTKITVDYGAKTVAFAPTEKTGNSGDLTFENFIPVAPIKLGDVGVRLAIDTGDESAINLSADYYAAHPSIFKPTSTSSIAGIGGSSDQVIGDLPEARFENFAIDGLKIGATKRLAATAKGHIGGGLLEHFAVTFDYAMSRIELTPKPGDASVHPA